VLYRPRSSLGPHSRPRAPTYTMSGFSGWMTMRPIWYDPSSPLCSHVLPPSMDLYTPLPHDTLLRGFASPVPTHTMLGSVCATATSPIETAFSRSNWCSKVTPLLVVFSKPPEAEAAQ